MNQRTLLILVGLGTATLGAGWYFGTASKPPQQTAIAVGQTMFPGLAATLKQAARIEITFQGKTTTIALKDGRWGIVDRAGYPVIESKLHSMLTVLTELRLAEPRTADPAQFGRLGVDDATKADSNANHLRILDAKGTAIVDVIVGHRRIRSQGKVEDQVYVRRPAENQAWLANGGLEADHDPGMWLPRDILDIKHDRIQSVVVKRSDAPGLTFTRKDAKLELTTPAEHPKLEDYKLEDIARGYESFTLQDVRAVSDPVGQTVGSSVFTTTDGLEITGVFYRADKDLWVNFTITGTGKAADEAKTLHARLSPWLFEIGAWKGKTLIPAMDDLKATEKPAEAPAKP